MELVGSELFLVLLVILAFTMQNHDVNVVGHYFVQDADYRYTPRFFFFPVVER